MPTYDYVCEACDHKFELYQSIKDNAIKKCPACGKLKLRRLFGIGAAVMFKGSGFYTTDYRSESYKKSAKADSAAQSGGDSKAPGDGKSTGETKSTSESDTASTPASTSANESKPKATEKKDSKRKK